MLEPDYYFQGRACYLSGDVGNADDCGYVWDNVNAAPYDIWDEVCGVFGKVWSVGTVL